NYYISNLLANISNLHSFPTRRSSDLELSRVDDPLERAFYEIECLKSDWSVRELKRQRDSMLYQRVGLSKDKDAVLALAKEGKLIDRKSTRLNSSHVKISYAVFCLKKK